MTDEDIKRLNSIREEEHVQYIVHNFPRSEWRKRIEPYVDKEEINIEEGMMMVQYATMYWLYSFLLEQLDPGFKVYYNLGDFFENLIDNSLWMVISLPTLDVRENNGGPLSWPDSLEDYGNRCEMFNVTDGVIYNEKSEYKNKYKSGYKKEYITPEKSNWKRLDDNEPRISDTIKEYQRILREDNGYETRLLKILDYELFPY